MGEGWSDFWALAFTVRPADTGETQRPFGAWIIGDGPEGPGFRTTPYSTDMAITPHTYAQLAAETFEEHDAGETWAAVLWDLHWLLVEQYGFDPDLIAGTGGNNLALRLVSNAIALQPCLPTYLEGRDAILTADLDLTGAANACTIWEAFARRGMGASANAGIDAFDLEITEAFDVPVFCPEPGGLVLGAAALLAIAALRGRTRV